MRRTKALPTLWLMTDERLGDALLPAIEAMPRGSGIVFRHYATAAKTRRALFRQIRAIAQRRGLILLRAGKSRLFGEHGTHNAAGRGLRSASVHSVREGAVARSRRVDLVFISPLYATRSHPGAATLGAQRAAVIAKNVGLPSIALGGMNAQRFKRLRGLGFHGWAGIDAWSAPDRRQKRNAVPM